MPFYEFRCHKCGHLESIFTRNVCSLTLSNCSSCGSGEVARVISSFVHQRSEKSRMDPWNMWRAKPGSWEEGKLHDMGIRNPRECAQEVFKAKRSDVEMFENVMGKKTVKQSNVDLKQRGGSPDVDRG